MPDTRTSRPRRIAKARIFVHTVHDLGLRTIGLVVANSVRRQLARRTELAARAPSGPPVSPGPLEEVTDVGAGARFCFARSTLEVSFLAEDVVRLSWGPGPEPVGYAVVDPSPWALPALTVAADDHGGRVLASAALTVEVRADGTVRLGRPDGTELRTLSPPVRRGPAWDERFRPRSGERFFGLGEQAASLELGGRRFRLWNRDPGGAWGPGAMPLYLNVPVFLSIHDDGCLLSFYENSTRATVSFPSGLDEPGEVAACFAGGILRQYVAVGDPSLLLDRYSALTGRPALPPRWALGYHQSRWGYKRDEDVRQVLDGYRAMDVPLSAVHLDIDYMRGYRVFTIDRARFPDLAALARRAGEQGGRLVTIVDPAVKVDDGYDLYRDGVAHRRFCTDPDGRVEVGVVWPGRAAFPDFTDPRTRSWWAEQYRTLTAAGVAGCWHDMNEPTSISLAGDPTLPLSTRHDFDGRGGDHGEGHNLYGLLMNRAGFEGLKAARPDRRPFIVSRSGWAGNQRYAWNWTGDVETTWAGLRQQMATVVGLGLSGIPYSGPDIGGFSGIPDDELYLRWLQMAVLLPFCRTHSVVGAPPREPWRFAEPVRAAVASWLRLRYRLLPYLYTLAHEAAAHGTPLVRPLWWPGPPGPPGPPGSGQPAAPPEPSARFAAVDDAYLLGDALLVAPVCEAGAATRDVPVPPGRWQSWWEADGDASVKEEGTGRGVPAPLERIPVLVRAGSVLPLDDGWAEPGGACALAHDGALDAWVGGPVSLDHAPRLLAWHCWPDDGSACGSAADDDGDGDGPVRRDELRLSGARPGAEEAVLHWTRTGSFPAPDRVRVVVHGFGLREALADGTPVPVRGGSVECGPFDELRLRGLQVMGGRTAPAP
jgi:alpha-glucosidase